MENGTALAGFSHIQLVVRDVDVSEPWYCGVFGFARFADGVADGRRYRALRHRASRLVVVLSDADPGDGGFSDHRIGLNHLALAVPSAADLDEWVARCDELAVEHEPVVVDAAGGRSLILRDPDGIQLELFASPPRAGQASS